MSTSDNRKYSAEPGSETGPQGGTFDREPRTMYVNIYSTNPEMPGSVRFSKEAAERNVLHDALEVAVPFREVLPGQAFQVDAPEAADTDHRHPAYCRGESAAMNAICIALEKTLDGDFRGHFIEPLESLRKRIIELVKQFEARSEKENEP